MVETRNEDGEPHWLQAMRLAARQRPRTQFVKIRWAQLQQLLREHDALWEAADGDTRARLQQLREREDYTYLPPHQRPAADPGTGGS